MIMIAKQFKPKIDPEKLAKMLGARKKVIFSKALSLKIRNLTEDLNSLLAPRIQYSTESVLAVSKGGVNISADDTFLKSVKLAKVLKPCNEAIVFVATIGEAIDDEIKSLMRHHYSTAYILDAMGSLAVESIVQQFQTKMQQQFMSRGLDTTLRFSPGYCDWNITEQRKLFALLPDNFSGVKLTDSCLMQPRKSISGIFGIYSIPEGTPITPFNPCLECARTECIARRT